METKASLTTTGKGIARSQNSLAEIFAGFCVVFS